MPNSAKVGNGTSDTSVSATGKARRDYKRGSGRERVLDAYTHILREEGAGAATLDEVARRADISKGGLLHHFGSKEALTEGLIARLEEQNAEDIAATMGNGVNGIEAFIAASMSASDDYSETFMAVIKLAGSGNDAVDEGLRRTLETWRDALDIDVKDPVLSRLIQLVGDGLYLHALVGAKPDEIDAEVVPLLRSLVEEGQK
ncbi:TetR/AcrR family transcriptional regulator [Timonella sp. A28]|uniref:TetR/AcrR family transcriptional regulator n=1 Tax=Timonella sp. A28 TaxID=3442640 RepID=UPI003EBAFC7D